MQGNLVISVLRDHWGNVHADIQHMFSAAHYDTANGADIVKIPAPSQDDMAV